MFERCSKNDDTYYLHPIIDWSDEDVWRYIRANGLKYCSLYDEVFKRIGCVMCPKSSKKQMIKEAKRWPKYYNAYMLAFERMLLTKPAHQKLQWKSAEDVMNWWIYAKHLDEDETVCEVFG